MSTKTTKYSNGAHLGLKQVLQIGCFLKLIPYSWDSQNQKLRPASKLGKFIFSCHKISTYFYTSHAWFRLIQAYLHGEFSLLSCLWAISNVNAFAGFLTLDWYQKDVLHFGNRLLGNVMLESAADERANHQENSYADIECIAKIESQDNKHLSYHMLFNLWLLYTNPEVHIFIVYQNPCAPNFVSSWFFECKSSLDDFVPFWEKLPFLIFEFYSTSKWQYISCLQWSLIYMSLAVVMTELRKLKSNTLESLCKTRKLPAIIYKYRKCQLLLTYLNDSFHYYLVVFPAVGTAVVAALIYGVIRLWRIDPETNIMFPLCAIRCAFEMLTPLGMAGCVNSGSGEVLWKWKKVVSLIRNKATFGGKRVQAQKTNQQAQSDVDAKGDMKLAERLQKSCPLLRCSSGSLFTFKSSIYLVTIDNTVQQTVNLLVSFPEL